MDINKSLRLIYASEGLLGLLRDDSINQQKRAEIINMLRDNFAELLNETSLSTPADISVVEQPEPIEATQADPESELIEQSEDEEFVEIEQAAEENISEPQIEANSVGEEPAVEESEEAVSEEEIAENVIFEEQADADMTDDSEQEEPVADNEAIIEIFDKPEQELAKATPDEHFTDLNQSVGMKMAGSEFSRVFTLNDKFRFRRELFGNSQVEFNDAINLVGAMRSLAEAEEYFYGELGWDPENEEVSAFMNIVNAYLINR